MRAVRRAAIVFFATLLPSCLLNIDLDKLDGSIADGGAGGAGGDGGDGGDSGDGADGGPQRGTLEELVCFTDAGPCIEATEVTNQAYAFFLENAAAAPESDLCKKNNLVPKNSWPFGQGTELHPVRGVTWCDAWIYCAWAGGRLCSAAEWTEACTRHGERTHPYGSAVDESACNGPNRSTTAAVKSHVRCEGGLDGVFDMSGNVAEWIDACVDGPGSNDTCELRGGGFDSDAAGLSCAAFTEPRRDRPDETTGFRCCK